MVEAILSMTEVHRFSKGIFSYVGFNTKYIPYNVEKREHGESKWNLKKLFKYALEGIIAFSTSPLKIATWIGSLTFIGSLLYLIVSLILGYAIQGVTLLVFLITLLFSINFWCIGLLSMYFSKTYIQSKNRPIYIVKTHLGKEKDER